MLKSMIILLLVKCFFSKQLTLKLNQTQEIQVYASTPFQANVNNIKPSSMKNGETIYVIELLALKAQTWSELNLEIIAVEQKQRTIRRCSGKGVLSCELPLLSSIKSLKIIAKSQQSGNYNITFYEDSYVQIDKPTAEIRINQHSSVYMKLPIKPSDFKQLRIELTPQIVSNYLEFYLFDKNDFTKFQQAIYLWQGKRGIFLKSQTLQQKWLDTSNYIYLKSTSRNLNCILTLTYQTLQQTHHDLQIPETINQFIPANQYKQYHLKIPELKQSQELTLKIVHYSGITSVIVYTDQAMNNKYKAKYFQYKSDSKFFFTYHEIKSKALTDLYIRISTNDHQCILKMDILKQSQQSASKLEQNSINFITIEKQQTKILYYEVTKQQQRNFDQNVQSQISVTAVVGKPKISLRIAYVGNINKIVQCFPDCLEKYTKQITNVRQSAVSLKTVYKINFGISKNRNTFIFMKINNVNSGNESQQIIIQYSITKSIIQLQEDTPLQQQIESSEKKLYQYIPLQKVKLVKLCYITITNDIGVLGCSKNPYQANSDWKTPNHEDNCVYFQNPQKSKPLYLSVYGQSVHSKYSLYVQTDHDSSILSVNKIQTTEDIQYKIKIGPLDEYQFILHPLYSHLQVMYNSTQLVDLCFLKLQKRQCDEKYTRNSEISGTMYENSLATVEKRSLLVKNPSLFETLTLRLKYHSGNYMHCETKQFGILYQQDLNKDTLCLQYTLPTLQEINQKKKQEFPIEIFITKNDYTASNIKVVLCDKIKIDGDMMGEKIELDFDMLMSCLYYQDSEQKGVFKKQAVFQIVIMNAQNQQISAKVSYIVQYQSRHLILPSNIIYTDERIIKPQAPLRYYSYTQQLASSKTTTITLKNRSPYSLKIKAFINHTSFGEHIKMIKNIDKLQYVYEGFSANFSRKTEIFIEKTDEICKQLEDKSQHKVQNMSMTKDKCNLIIIVEADQAGKYAGQRAQYSIQITHGFKIIKQFQTVNSQLSDLGDTDTYRFYPNLQQQMPQRSNKKNISYQAFIKLSTNNQQCANIKILNPNKYLKTNNQNDLQIQMPQDGVESIRIIKQLSQTVYIIQIQAIAINCHYSLDLMTYFAGQGQQEHERMMGYISLEHQQDIKFIQANKTQYYLTDLPKNHNQHNNKLSIIYLRKYGAIRIYAIQATEHNIHNIFNHKGSTMSYLTFPYQQQFPNVFNLPSQNNQTTQYIIAIQSQQKTEGTLLLHQQNRQIKLPITKSLLLPLEQQQCISVYYYMVSEYQSQEMPDFTLSLFVFYGQIQMKVAIVDKNNQIFPLKTVQADNNDKCCKSGKQYLFNYSISAIQNSVTTIQNIKYILIQIQNINKKDEDISLLEVNVKIDRKQLSIDTNTNLQELERISLFKNQNFRILTLARNIDHKVLINIDEHRQYVVDSDYLYDQNQSQNSTNNNLLIDNDKIVQNQQNNNNNKYSNKDQLKCIQILAYNAQNKKIMKTNITYIGASAMIIQFDWQQYVFDSKGYKILLEISLNNDQCTIQQLPIRIATDIRGKMKVLIPWHWNYVQGSRQFTIPTNQTFYLDFSTCSGNADLQYFNSYKQIKQSKQTTNKSILARNNLILADKPNIMKIIPESSITFLRISSPQAVFRYIMVDQEKQLGVGYIKYKWQGFRFETSLNKIIIYINQVQKIQPTETVITAKFPTLRLIKDVNISNQQLKCRDVDAKTIIQKNLFNHNKQKYQLPKEQVLKHLNETPQNVYLQIQMTIILSTPGETATTEIYKFKAPIQQIPADIFKIIRIETSTIIIAIIVINVVFLLIVGLGLAVVKLMPRFFRRMVNFAEQDTNPRQENQEVPASSDRNSRMTELTSERSSKQKSNEEQDEKPKDEIKPATTEAVPQTEEQMVS